MSSILHQLIRQNSRLAPFLLSISGRHRSATPIKINELLHPNDVKIVNDQLYGPGIYFAKTGKVSEDLFKTDFGDNIYKLTQSPINLLYQLLGKHKYLNEKNLMEEFRNFIKENPGTKGYKYDPLTAKVELREMVDGRRIDWNNPFIQYLNNKGYIGYSHRMAFTNWRVGVPGSGYGLNNANSRSILENLFTKNRAPKLEKPKKIKKTSDPSFMDLPDVQGSTGGLLKNGKFYYANGGLVRGYSDGGEAVPPPKIDKAMSDRWQNMGRVFGPLTPGQGFDINNVPGLLREITGSEHLTEAEKYTLKEYVSRPLTLLAGSFDNGRRKVGNAIIRNKFKIDAGTKISRVSNSADMAVLQSMKPGQSVILDRFMSVLNDNHPTSKSFIADMVAGQVDTGGRGVIGAPIIKFNLKTDAPGINNINHLIPGLSNVSDGLLAPGVGMKLIKVRYEKGSPVYYFDVGTNIKAKHGFNQLYNLKLERNMMDNIYPINPVTKQREYVPTKYRRLSQDWYQEVKAKGLNDDSGIIKYIKSNGNSWSQTGSGGGMRGGGGGGGMLTNFGIIMSQLFADGGLVRKYAMGGPVSPINFTRNGLTYPKFFADGGFAMGTDTVPAMLTPGEFVIKKSAVDRIGTDLLHKLNGFAEGGVVGGGSSTGSTSIGDSVYNYSISVNVSSQSDPSQIARVVMNEIKKIDNHRVRGSNF